MSIKKEEIEDTEKKVLQERHSVLDACIVKIMKERKTASHTDLVMLVFNNLKLPISVKTKFFFFINFFSYKVC